jgi:DNA-binding LacI/PurR family transcriptional regulator
MTTPDHEQLAPSARPRKRATSEDVARASGVSRATVSYVLNNAEGRNISEQTRRLVHETAKRLGHVPFAPARALSSGRSDIVLALVPGFTLGYVFEQGLEALDVALAERGAALMVHRHLESVRHLSDLWKLVSPELVVTTGGLSEPEVESIGDSDARLVDIGSIVPHRTLGRAQAEHLIERGHRRAWRASATPAPPTAFRRPSPATSPSIRRARARRSKPGVRSTTSRRCARTTTTSPSSSWRRRPREACACPRTSP